MTNTSRWFMGLLLAACVVIMSGCNTARGMKADFTVGAEKVRSFFSR